MSIRVHEALLQVAGVLSANNTIQCEENKTNINVQLGITLEV